MLLHRDATHYEPVNWDDAFELLAAELNSLNYPDQAVFYTSGRTSNEAAFLYQLFVRQFLHAGLSEHIHDLSCRVLSVGTDVEQDIAAVSA